MQVITTRVLAATVLLSFAKVLLCHFPYFEYSCIFPYSVFSDEEIFQDKLERPTSYICLLLSVEVQVVWGEIEIQQPPFSASIVALVIDSLPAESHALHPGFAFILKSNK